MPDALRRSIRTFLQAFCGVIIAQSGAILLDAQKGEYVLDIEWIKRIGVSAAVSGVIALVTFIQNYAEDNSNFPSMLKASASGGQNPVTIDPKV